MISTDQKIFQEGSDVANRMVEYSKRYEELHIIVFGGKSFQETSLSSNCWVYPTKSKNKVFSIFDAIRLGRFIISRRGITNVTCQDPFFTAVVGFSLKKQFNISLELQIHTDIGSPNYIRTFGNKLRKIVALSYLIKADHIRVVSERIRKYLIEKLKINNSKIEVRPIYVDVEKIKSIPVTVDLHKKYSDYDRIILVASRLEKEKNIKLAIEAFSYVLKKMPRSGLIIIGQGSELSKLKNLSLKKELNKSIAFESWANLSTLVSYYKTADLFLVTSWYEGYGMTLIEAQAAGCKIVSTDVGVAREAGATIVGYNALEVSEAIVRQLQ